MRTRIVGAKKLLADGVTTVDVIISLTPVLHPDGHVGIGVNFGECPLMPGEQLVGDVHLLLFGT